MDNEYNITDLISLSFDQKPVDFQNAFNSIMSDKISAAIDDKKLEVAQTMFNYDDEEIDDESEQEDQDQEEDASEEENNGEIS